MAELSSRLADLHVSSSTPSTISKRPAGATGTPLVVSTNIYELTCNREAVYYKYDLRVYAVYKKRDGEEVMRELTKQTRDDYNEQQRKTACTEIFLHLVDSGHVLFKGTLIYDRAAILVTLQRLPDIGTQEMKIELPPSCQTVSADAQKIVVTLKQAAEGARFAMSDLPKVVNAEFKNTDKSLLEVLNLATSQTAFFSRDFITYGNGVIYLAHPEAYGFQAKDLPTIRNDMFIGIGLSKAVKVLEGPVSTPDAPDYVPCLIGDVKKTAFHYENQPLVAKMVSMFGENLRDPSSMSRELRDIRCLMSHKPGAMTIGGLTPKPIGECTFQSKTGETTPIARYFKERYNVEVANLKFPGVIDKYTKAIYPCEVLTVAPKQRVKTEQAGPKVIEELIKVSAIQPEIRLRQTKGFVDALGLGSDKLRDMGVILPANSEPLKVQARQLMSVKLQGGGTGRMNGPSWRSSPKFAIPASISKWAAFCLHSARRQPPTIVESFVTMLVSSARAKGMQISEPLKKSIAVGQNVQAAVTEMMENAKEAGCEFVLNICEDSIADHQNYKHAELQYGIITQEVKLTTATRAAEKRQMQTVENIAMKMNAKNGGTTHVVAADGSALHLPNTIIIGLFIEQPRISPQMEGTGVPHTRNCRCIADWRRVRVRPNEVLIELNGSPTYRKSTGYRALRNGMMNELRETRSICAQQYFTTGYRYAHPRGYSEGEPQTTTLKNYIVETLKQFKANRGSAPMKVIVYRGGVSEGQLKYVASTERDVFLSAFRELAATYSPDFLMIATSKDHNERFYPEKFPGASGDGRRVDQNLAPGVVIDKSVVNPESNEFFLQSHKALQGTAKATKYTLAHDSTGRMPMDALEHLTNSLCHLHEIVNSTTSIPTPLYVAEESSRRGVELYHHVHGHLDTYSLTVLNQSLVPQGKLAGVRYNA